MMKNEQIDWGGMFKIAILRFGIAPSEFWQMTLTEFLFLLEEDVKEENFADVRKFLNEKNGVKNEFD